MPKQVQKKKMLKVDENHTFFHYMSSLKRNDWCNLKLEDFVFILKNFFFFVNLEKYRLWKKFNHRSGRYFLYYNRNTAFSAISSDRIHSIIEFHFFYRFCVIAFVLSLSYISISQCFSQISWWQIVINVLFIIFDLNISIVSKTKFDNIFKCTTDSILSFLSSFGRFQS